MRLFMNMSGFVILTGLLDVFGGVGRVLSLIALGAPPALFMGLMFLELLGAPALVFWQARLSRQS